VSKELAILGIHVDEILQAADEGATALGALGRLDESTGRVHQRVTELNKRLLNGQTQLLKAKKTSSSGTTLANALRGLAGLRQKQVTQSKRVRTKTKTAKKNGSPGVGTKA
jgi:hypothetical protein